MYKVGIDSGGTFTDLVGIDADGTVVVAKHPSTPRAPMEAFLGAIRKSGVADAEIERIAHGTTVATNAIIQRQGARVAFVTTRGFEDVPFIQRINRKREYDLHWQKPQPLVRRRWCVGVRERVDATGGITVPLDDGALEEVTAAIRALPPGEAPEAIAVCLLFAFLNPRHELMPGEHLGRMFPGLPISLSHQVAPIWREYERSSTVLADAFVKPLVDSYCDSIGRAIAARGDAIHCSILKSDGGTTLLANAARRPVDILLSGLAGGLVGGRYWARRAGIADAITLDMGGTSADVGLVVGGQQRFTTEFEIEWGLPVAVPIVEVRTLGAGGGSIAWVDKGGMLNVGPQSAGAAPGPAAYAAGGQDATVTDANLVLGRLDPGYFLGGEMVLDAALARDAVARVAQRLGQTVEQTAAAIIDIADENMTNAIRLATIERGIDPRGFALVAFGGAGPLHAVAIARKLGIPRVVVPPHPGLVSALGAAISELRVEKLRTVAMLSDQTGDDALIRQFAEMEADARVELAAEGLRGEAVAVWKLSMRYFQQNYEQDVTFTRAGGLAACLAQFHRLHEEFYGYSFPDQPVELVHLRLSVHEVERGDTSALRIRAAMHDAIEGVRTRSGWDMGGRAARFAVHRRAALPPGKVLAGPAIVEEVDSTTFVPSGTRLEVHESGNLIITEAA
ncbi:MAG TPA: hydantoinase/oxoprolinase family protein [Acetobacteraceae bacterium]|nr:hydantoinase/oxoprolinase family protein [Acetobacteraceae bacterium]